MTNKIRISARDESHFEIVIINDRGVFNQGRAHGAETIEAAHAYAMAHLPSAQTTGATWEHRSEEGVYSKLDF